VLRTLRNRLAVAWAALRGHAIVSNVAIRGTLYIPDTYAHVADSRFVGVNRGQKHCIKVGIPFESNKGASL
jgi:hypothetical protein